VASGEDVPRLTRGEIEAASDLRFHTEDEGRNAARHACYQPASQRVIDETHGSASVPRWLREIVVEVDPGLDCSCGKVRGDVERRGHRTSTHRYASRLRAYARQYDEVP